MFIILNLTKKCLYLETVNESEVALFLLDFKLALNIEQP